MADPWYRDVPFRLALGAGLSAGPVLAVLWPVFARLESGDWPASMVALTVAMLTLGVVVGLGAAFTLLFPLAMLLNLRRGAALLWQAPLLGAGLCALLMAVFGLVTGAERLGAQWPLWLTMALAGAACGLVGALVANLGGRQNS
ncbi:MAG: hypothetical protein Q4G70_03105 [Pseudomonadota bacterium]|nr:hypothetical protein [Pseudomonadota bacterium]